METFYLGLRHGEEAIDVAIGDGYVLYTGGCEGVDQTAEEMGLQLGFKVHVLVGPHYPRAQSLTPPFHRRVGASQSFSARSQSNPSSPFEIFYSLVPITLNCFNATIISSSRPRMSMRLENYNPIKKPRKGGPVGACNWLSMPIRPFTFMTFPLKHGQTSSISMERQYLVQRISF